MGPRRPPLAHVLAHYDVPTTPDRPTFALSPYQTKRLAETIEGFFREHGTLLQAGLLPVRVDAHPDGRVRLVLEATEVPASFHHKDTKVPPEGKWYTMTVAPVDTGAYGWRGEPWTKFDPDPAWFLLEDVQFAPNASPPMTPYSQTLEEALDASGFKQPAKLRAVRDQHWRNVASALRRLRPVTPEVLADYPGLRRFYGRRLVAAPTKADLLAARDVLDNPDNPHVTLSWNPQEGMFLRTRGKESAIISAVRGLRGVRFKWSSNLGLYYRPQSVGVSESTVSIDYVARQLREAGLVVAIERGDVSTLGVANTRRQEHKFWRAEGYAERAEGAIDKSDEARARAADLRSDLPVGAASRQAERAEARADRADAKAGEHLDYATHAAGAAQSLAHTAAGYDTTVTLTRKQAERRADAFAALFVPRVKGLTGALRLVSDKVDNLSEYRLTWVVFYPKGVARVIYDGRAVWTQVWPDRTSTGQGFDRFDYLRGRGNPETVLQQEVSGLEAADVFALVVQALPKVERVKVDVSGDVPADAMAMVKALWSYSGPRTAAAFKGAIEGSAAPIKLTLSYLDGMPGKFLCIAPMRGQGEYAFPIDPKLYLVPREGMAFELARNTPEKSGQSYARAFAPTATVALDLSGRTIGEAWAILVAAGRALFAGRAYEAPTALPKPPKARTRTVAPKALADAPGGGLSPLARDAAAAEARARRDQLAAGVAETMAAVEARRGAIEGGSASVAAARAVADATGKSGGFYPTPPTLAKHVVDLAEVEVGQDVLEPSAGMGALVGELLSRPNHRPRWIQAIEADPQRAAFLRAEYALRGASVEAADFLAVPPVPRFDAVVMNPPFSIGSSHYTDALHVLHALAFVKPGGRLVAIMSPGSSRADNPRRRALHEALAGWRTSWESVDAKRFRISGTDVASIILVAERPRTKTNPRPRR